MALKISENKKKEVVITLSGPVDQDMIEHVVNYMRYLQVQRKSKATQADVDRLAMEVKRSMGRKRRERMAS
jgi:hypothetical protein